MKTQKSFKSSKTILLLGRECAGQKTFIKHFVDKGYHNAIDNACQTNKPVYIHIRKNPNSKDESNQVIDSYTANTFQELIVPYKHEYKFAKEITLIHTPALSWISSNDVNAFISRLSYTEIFYLTDSTFLNVNAEDRNIWDTSEISKVDEQTVSIISTKMDIMLDRYEKQMIHQSAELNFIKSGMNVVGYIPLDAVHQKLAEAQNVITEHLLKKGCNSVYTFADQDTLFSAYKINTQQLCNTALLRHLFVTQPSKFGAQ